MLAADSFGKPRGRKPGSIESMLVNNGLKYHGSRRKFGVDGCITPIEAVGDERIGHGSKV